MGLRAKFEDKIKRKEQEILEYEAKIRETKAYLQALQDSLKLIPKENENAIGEHGVFLRPGSAISKTYAVLKKADKPLHITEILNAIGKGTSKKERVSLSGSLGWYVRRKEIFIRSSPNTFGLIGMGHPIEPPEDFGMDNDEES